MTNLLRSSLLVIPPCIFRREVFQFILFAFSTSTIVLVCQMHFDLLVFDKLAIQRGEYWRLISGHFVHSSFSHGFWDVLAFSVSVVWLGVYSVRAILSAVIMGIVMVSALLLSSWSSWAYYCGLSGVLFSPLVVAACLHAKHLGKLIGFVPLLVILVKLGVDLISREAVFVDSAWQVYPEAHLAGVVGGFFVVIGVVNKVELIVGKSG